jgi:tetratricopeptide (TPR) repeat protein
VDRDAKYSEEGLLAEVAWLDYSRAVAYCEQAIERGAAPEFWRRQLAYCLLLDETGPMENQWQRAPSLLAQLLDNSPEDADLHFWRGYLLRVILAGYDEEGMKELRTALAQDHGHPYANLVLSAYADDASAVELLKRTLSIQPGNVRALATLAERLDRLTLHTDAARARDMILKSEPYFDTEAPMILRHYINSVLTGALIVGRYRAKASTLS